VNRFRELIFKYGPRVKLTRPFLILFSFFVFHASLFTLPGLAQVGTWQPQVSFLSGRAVAVAGQTAFGASENGFFAVDLTTGITTPYDKTTGLGDAGITRLLYLPDRQALLLAYRSGLLELVPLSPTGQPRPDSIQTIATLRDAPQLSGSRQINGLLRMGTDVYLATDFGIVVLDLVRATVRDTYRNIGPGGLAVAVRAVVLAGDSLLALTDRGLLSARFSGQTNLGFFDNWRVSPGPAGQTPTDLVPVPGNRLVASVPGRGVFVRRADAGGWALVQGMTDPSLRIFPAPGGYLTLTTGVATLPDASRRTSPLLTDPRDALLTDGSRLLVADARAGLLDLTATTTRQLVPNGPASDVFAQVVAFAQAVVALPGGPNAALIPLNRRPGFDALTLPNGWQTADRPANVGTAVADAVGQTVWLGSFGDGLWQLPTGPATGSPTPAPTPVPVELPVGIDRRISSVAIDANRNVWLATPSAPANLPALHVRLAASGAFQSYQISRRDVLQILIDDPGFLWLRLSPAFGGGLLVYDPNTNRSRQLYAAANDGNLPAPVVLSMVKDRTGSVWVGTTAGVAVFDDPAGVFTGNVNARTPIFGRRGLLREEAVSAIAVDGGNQKWIGTGNGLYRFSPDGTQLLDNFTTANSPLPANAIGSIGIEPGTGQVFVATANGLIAYRAAATEPADGLREISIFPNPVRPDFGGVIAVRGLTDRATVKILDAGGQLVFETRAEGGTATWNGRDYRGRTAQTGVYIVVVIGADGREGVAGKLAIVR
jgi:hypothetical protein